MHIANSWFFKLSALVSFFLFVAGPVYAQCGAGIPSGGNPNCIPPPTCITAKVLISHKRLLQFSNL